MLTELFIFGLLCSTASPLPNAESNEEATTSTPVNQKMPCADQIEWIENKTLEAKKQFARYYSLLAKNHIDLQNLGDEMTQLTKMNTLVANSLGKYTVELNKVLAMTANDTNQLKVCTEELEKFGIMSQNVLTLMQSIQPKVINLTRKLELSPDTIDGLHRSLGRMVMLSIDIANHTVEHRFIHNGVKTITDKPEEGEIIGHAEESTTGIVEMQSKTPNPTTKAVHDEYEDAEDEKAFDDLISNRDPEIEKADKELLNREKQVELEETQQDKYLLERAAVLREEQIKSNEILNPI